jgi:hypothetical protein
MMTRVTTRLRGAIALGALAMGACNVNHELLAPQTPQVISPGSVANATAADALYAGALDRWKNAMNGNGGNTEALWNWQALFTDELRSADTFSQRNDDDQRNLQTNDGVLTPIYNNGQQARGRARDAINSLLQFDTSPTGKQHVGEMYMMMGYIEMIMSESFCNGIPFGETVNGVPHYVPGISSVDGAKLASVRLDTALSYFTAPADARLKNVAKIIKARAQVDIGDYAGAAATVAAVPDTTEYDFDYSITTFDNEWFVMGPSLKRYNAGDSVSAAGIILNAIPFAQLKDPRVSVTNTGQPAEDRKTTFIQVNNWGRDDPMPVVSGIDARLIEGEAKLNANDIAGMVAILNALRTAPRHLGLFQIAAMAALPTPADKNAATNLFFREKALWQFERGYRMGDLRRLVRQYGRSQDQVYPSGGFARNTVPSGNYGTQVAFPVPDAERSNPLFAGCLDLKA